MYVMKVYNEALLRQTIHTTLHLYFNMNLYFNSVNFCAVNFTVLCWYPVSSLLMEQWASFTLV